MRRDKQDRTEFDRAVQVFLHAPHTKLIRYICHSLITDPTYVLRNLRSIEQVMGTVLRLQGIDISLLQGTAYIEIIRAAGTRLKIKVNEERWRMY